MRRAITAIGAFTLIVLAIAPFGSTQPTGAAHPLRMTVGTVGHIGSLDPRRGDSVIAQEVWNLQYPTLTSLDPQTLDPKPGVASAWSPTADGWGWIYTLRRGLTWSDGKPVTADDVVYSLELPGITREADAQRMFAGFKARALSERSVEVRFATRNRPGPSLLLHVVPKHVFEATDNVDSDVAALGVSDGTWHVVAKSSDSVRLQATAPIKGPTLFEIVFRTFPNDGSLIDALDRKQVDVISGLPTSDIGKLERLRHVTVDHASDGSQYVLRDSLPDERIRQAISLAIDRNKLVTDVVSGVGTPGVVPLIARGATWALDTPAVDALTAALDAQPNRARQLLAEARPLDRKLVVAGNAPGNTASRVVSFVRSELNAVGVETMTGPEGISAGRGPDLIVELDRFIGDNGPDNLYWLLCPSCPGFGSNTRYLAPKELGEQVSFAHSRLQSMTEQAKVVGLFEPDTLQAFRTDNVTGFLRDPEIRSLVVFGPTVAQYSQLIAAPPPPGEQLSNTAYAVGAVIVLGLCGVVFLFAAWIRRRFAGTEGAI